MIATTPFSLTDLTDNRTGEASNKSRDKDQNLNDRAADQQRRPMTFDIFGVGVAETNEPERLYTAEDLDRAVEDARRAAAAETEAELRASMAKDIEQRRCETLSAIKAQLEQKEAAFEEELAHMSVVSQGIALALAEAVIPKAMKKQPLADITDALKATLQGLVSVPAIELRLHPSALEFAEPLLAEVTKDAGFAGDLITLADPDLGEGDAELRWQSGVLSRRLKCLQSEALKLADCWLELPLENEGDEAGSASSTSSKIDGAGDPPDQPHDTEAMNERTIR
ncbi:MAG: FliH/SctL family protein [Pseudomonadota bacterium]